MEQYITPLADALEQMLQDHYICFDVPGHKGTAQDLSAFFGERCVRLDVNSRNDIDYLCQPRSVIRQAEQLAADAFGAQDAFFMVGGTTASVQAMIMSACAPGDKIILPRNVHSSVINAVILSGAIPVYIDPVVHPRLGIALGMRMEDFSNCIRQNTDAKAVFVNNPTYYGICSNIKEIVRIAHEHQILVLADEAHGTHFYFHEELPAAAIQCGADLAAVSMHKTGGSFTQSAILLSSGTIPSEHINTIINLTRTTSASYLLMASLDIARKNLALQGKSILDTVIRRAEQTRKIINSFGYYAFSDELLDGDSIFDFDKTKLSIHTADLGLAGIEVYTLLRDQYRIQIEFGDMRNILALCTLGDTDQDHAKLLRAMQEISAFHRRASLDCPSYEYISPILKISPRKAFYAKKTLLPIRQCVGRICGDSVMAYPPGIPLLAPGELITQQIVDHILCASEMGCSISGLLENDMLNVVM